MKGVLFGLSSIAEAQIQKFDATTPYLGRGVRGNSIGSVVRCSVDHSPVQFVGNRAQNPLQD